VDRNFSKDKGIDHVNIIEGCSTRIQILDVDLHIDLCRGKVKEVGHSVMFNDFQI